MSSGYEINVEQFEAYTVETKERLTSLYPWYEMSPTIHKILEHGGNIIRHHLVPIGQLTVEAQEARNKECRKYRLTNTRKSTRLLTNRDLLAMLLCSSDPVVASYRSHIKKSGKPLDALVLQLLASGVPPQQSDESSLMTPGVFETEAAAKSDSD